ncbi:MAG: response regulator transcription factor [Burkholderiaceae bacterium]
MKVLLIDDHVLFRRGVELLLSDLEPELAVIHGDRVEQIDPAALGEVDLVLLDMNLPGGVSGLTALTKTRELLPDVPLVVVSGESDPGVIRNCIDLGAGGFIPKSATPELMIGALRLVLAGGVYLPSLVLDEVGVGFWAGARVPVWQQGLGVPEQLSPFTADPVGSKLGQIVADDEDGLGSHEQIGDVLSRRQLEALMHAVQGKSNKAIAREMNIAEGTVKLHLSAVYRALGVANRTQAVFVAAKLGLRRAGR